MWPLAALAIGLGTAAAGTAMSASAADRQRKGLFKIANEPGLDTKALTLQALRDLTETFPESTRVADLINAYYGRQLEEQGLAPLRRSMMEQAAADLAGEIPRDVADRVYREAAARALTGGFSGGALHGGLALRNLGLTSDALRQRGFQKAGQLLTGYSMPGSFDPVAAGMIGLTPAQLINLRSGERAMRLQMLTRAEMSPRGDAIWGNWLNQVGGSIAGMGMMGMGGGMGGMGGMMGGAAAGTARFPGLGYGDFGGMMAGVGIGNPMGSYWRSYYGG